MEAFEQAIELNSNDAIAYHSKGWLLNDLKRHEEALLACEKALQLDPNYALAYHTKGFALLKLKRYEDALADFEQAIQDQCLIT